MWKSAEMVDVSHILISNENRSKAAAGAIVIELWEQLEADPSLFDVMVTENSEDPSKSVNQGRFSNVKREEMVKSFVEAAFAMETPGQISSPVETQYGFHIIRLNQNIPGTVLPFDQVKEQAVILARESYLNEYGKRYLKNLLDTPIVLTEGAAEEMAKRYFGEDLELAPVMPN
jgi:parvulin-like peptidyl-prolyl isomerase